MPLVIAGRVHNQISQFETGTRIDFGRKKPSMVFVPKEVKHIQVIREIALYELIEFRGEFKMSATNVGVQVATIRRNISVMPIDTT